MASARCKSQAEPSIDRARDSDSYNRRRVRDLFGVRHFSEAMMQENLPAALTFIVETLEDLSVNENEPASVGRVSKGGVTLVDYEEFCARNGLPVPTAETIRNLTEDQIKDVYARQFAGPLRFAYLPGGVDCAVLGFSVQAGVTGGIRLLALGTGFWPIPTTFTDELLAHVNSMDARCVIGAVAGAWLAKRDDMPDRFREYGHGWANRLLKQDSEALTMVKP